MWKPSKARLGVDSLTIIASQNGVPGTAFRKRRGCRLTAMLVLLMAGCSSKPEPSRTNVVLITVDTLRADRVGCYGNSSVETPEMDQLARDGAVFRRAIAQVPLTTPSHAAILTGAFPIWNGLRDWADHGLRPGVPTLAEIFKRHGYVTAAFVSAMVLDSMWGLNRGFDHYDDHFQAEDYKAMRRMGLERRGEETIDRSIAWLQSRPPRPFFLWLHLYDPHSPYAPPEPFKSRYRDRPYDGEVAYADRELGRLLNFLKAQNLYSDALVVLTSDHGESLGEHQEQEHGFFIYNSTVRVPLILKFPSRYVPKQRSVSTVVNTVDIAPTLAQLCSFPSVDMRTFQGQSLLPLVEGAPAGAPRRGFSESLYPGNFFGAHTLAGIETERYRYIRAPKEELYDLEQDPGERRNIFSEKRSVAQSLRETLESTMTRLQPSAGETNSGSAIDPEVAEKLRSLGYVSLSRPRRDGVGFDASAPDPKDLIGDYNQVMRSIEIAEGGRFRQANLILAGLARKYPRDYLLQFLQGENSLRSGDPRSARNLYRRALELNPTFDQAASGLGRAAYEAEENAEAANAFQLALRLNPRDFFARLALARVYWRLGRLDEAANEQLQVLADHPHFAQAHAEYGVTLVRLKKYPEGLQSLMKGVTMGYRDATVYNFMANAYLAEGNVEEAIRSYEQAVAIDAQYPTALINLSLIYQQRGERQKAREYYQRACRINAELCRELAGRLR
jgi:arylsulfatase A-like enzyme/Tfp pilus assembly protein PilF